MQSDQPLIRHPILEDIVQPSGQTPHCPLQRTEKYYRYSRINMVTLTHPVFQLTKIAISFTVLYAMIS